MKNEFTVAQLKSLTEAFKNIDEINPESPAYLKMRELISKLSDEQLKSLIPTNIKFVSGLCRNEFFTRKRAGVVPAAVAKLAEVFGQGAPVTQPVDPVTRYVEKDARIAAGGPANIPAKGKPTENDLISFRNKLEDFMAKHHAENYTRTRDESMVLTIGKKFAKICNVGPATHSAYCFISLETGEIFKPANFDRPAKHARGTIFQSDDFLFGQGKVCGPYGIIYLR